MISHLPKLWVRSVYNGRGDSLAFVLQHLLDRHYVDQKSNEYTCSDGTKDEY